MTTSEIELIRSLCRESYVDFFREFWSETSAEPLRWNWHLDLICADLQRMAERVHKRLPKEHDEVINISPGTSKSSAVSILFPAWVWTFFPEAQFICMSHAEELALDLSGKCRDVIKSEKYQKVFPWVRIRPDRDAITYYKNTKGGWRYAVGSNGSIIGKHAHFILIDDPIDPKKAISEAEMKSINHTIKATLRSRKVNKLVTVTILVMQRLHQNDPTAQMLARKKGVRHLRIPAELAYKVHPPELKEHYVDGLMDPVGLPRSFLDEEKLPTGLGETGYAGQYGQDPVPAGGGLFKTDRLKVGQVPGPNEWKTRCRYWDKAGTEKGGAYSVGVLGGEDIWGRVWILHVVRKQKDSFARERMILSVARNYDGRRVIIGVEQEGGSGGKESAEGSVRRLKGFRVRTLSPRGDKELRADEFSVQVNGGNVYLPEEVFDAQTQTWTSWAEEFVEELKHFPHSTYKDQVDAASGMHTVITRKNRRVGAMRKRSQALAAHKPFDTDDEDFSEKRFDILDESDRTKQARLLLREKIRKLTERKQPPRVVTAEE